MRTVSVLAKIQSKNNPNLSMMIIMILIIISFMIIIMTKFHHFEEEQKYNQHKEVRLAFLYVPYL